MSQELQTLYQELILEHSRYPRNYGRLENPTHHAHGYNPLCGDEVELSLRVEGDQIKEVKFEGKSCAICKASASVMTTLIKGQAISEVDKMFQAFHEVLTEEEAPTYQSLAPAVRERIGAFGSVRNFPMRVKCATLPWHTLHAALHPEKGTTVTTE